MGGGCIFQPTILLQGEEIRIQTAFQVESGGYSSPLGAEKEKSIFWVGGGGSIGINGFVAPSLIRPLHTFFLRFCAPWEWEGRGETQEGERTSAIRKGPV